MNNYFFLFERKGIMVFLIALLNLSANANAIFSNATNGGQISQNQTICPGQTPLLFQNVTNASGGDPNLPLEFLWIASNTPSAPMNTWNPAPGSNNSLTYQAGPLGSTTYFVRCARRQGFTEYVAESNIVEVVVLNTATAIINGAPSGSIFPGSTVNLSATPSPGATYSWDFNGDGFPECTSQNCSYTFNTTGVFPVALTVTNAQGCPITTTIPITVVSPTGFGYNDPCNCGNPLNYATPTALYINDFILINSAPGQTWTLANTSLGQVFDNNGNQLPTGTVIPETSAGQYFLNIWFVSGVGYGSTFTNGSNTVSTGTTNPCNCLNPLPVDLVDFTVEPMSSGNIMLKWNTASENNNSHFQIERSMDGIRFDFLSVVEGAGTTNTSTYYSFEDKSPLHGRTYYRLKQVDFDGGYEYSPVRQVYLEGSGISIYPSPAEAEITIRPLNKLESDALIEVVNADARLIHRYQINKDDNFKTISLADFDPGVYFVKIIFANGSYETGSFMKN